MLDALTNRLELSIDKCLRLPVIEHVFSLYPDAILADSFLIGCGHLLPSMELFLSNLVRKGLAPENITLIGKCYSVSTKTIQRLRQIGINIESQSEEFDSHLCYREEFPRYVENFLMHTSLSKKLKKYKNIIILDDGGVLHTIVNHYLDDASNVIGIEQTSRGIYQLSNQELKYPIVNVARCATKLTYESTMVAEAIVSGLTKASSELSMKLNKLLVIGCGSIGQSVKELLSDSYEVATFDLKQNRSCLTEYELRRQGATFDAIIGATGQDILPLLENNNLLKKQIILASASSLDIEFGAAKLRKKIAKTLDCHQHLVIGDVHLLNCGFPINFNGGDSDGIPLDKFQLTLSLLAAGLLQLIQGETSLPRLIELEPIYQNLIVDKYFAYQAVSAYTNDAILTVA